jgi:biotin carboxyl carrier protein
MPATVRKVHVAAGDEVRRGDVLVVLEAMKMELPVRAPHDGSVDIVKCSEGEMVEAGQVLVELGI